MIRLLIGIYTWIILADIVLSYIPQYKHHEWAKMVKKLAGFTCDPIRKILPKDLPFDFSSIIVLIALQIIPSLW
ncbi:MAG: YggT family protein [Halobacteriovoraceae bacterium]|jgi:YggT family protein|nr:YggT family protein [Halobacteriovoraceae bacterium]